MSAIFHIESDHDCVVYNFGKEYANIFKGQDNEVIFSCGRHKVEFVSKIHPQIRLKRIVSVPSEEYEDFIELDFTSACSAMIPDSLLAFNAAINKSIDDYYSAHSNRSTILSDGLFGYTDNSGRVVIPFIFREAHEFREGLAAVMYSDFKWGIIDVDGNFVVNPCYVSILEYKSCAFCENEDGSWCVFFYETHRMSKNYESVEWKEYYDIEICAKRNGKIYVIDKDGQERPEPYVMSRAIPDVFSPTYVDIGDEWEEYYLGNPITDNNEVVFLVSNVDERIGFARNDGTIVFKPEYDRVERVVNDHICVVKKGDLFGVVNVNDGSSVPCKYDWLAVEENGVIRAELAERWGLIDLEGNIVCDFIYDSIESFSHGWARVIYDSIWIRSRYNYINTDGIRLFSEDYDCASTFNCNVALVCKTTRLDDYHVESIISMIDDKGNFLKSTVLPLEREWDDMPFVACMEQILAGCFIVVTLNEKKQFLLSPNMELKQVDWNIHVWRYGDDYDSSEVYGLFVRENVNPNSVIEQHPYPTVWV